MQVLRLVCVSTMFGLMSLWGLPVKAGVEGLSVTDMQLESKKRVGRAFFQYEYTITVANPGEPLDNVVGTVVSTNGGVTQIVDSQVILGAVATGNNQSTDTFIMRQNRRHLFNPADLVWTFSGDPVNPTNTAPTADAGPDQTANSGDTVQLSGAGSSDPEADSLSYAWSLSVPGSSNAQLTSISTVAPTFTPDEAGIYSATLIVNDGELDSAPSLVSIAVAFSGDNAPIITSDPNIQGEISSAYTYFATASDLDQGDTLTWSLLAAPTGMSIDSNSGLIRWTPDTSGPADVDVLVTDAAGLSDRQIYLILVNSGPSDQAPTLASIPNQSVVAGRSISVAASATDPENEAVRYGLANPPVGVSIHSATGQIAWTPAADQVGSAPVTVTASDPGGLTDQTTFSVSVLSEQTNNAPVINDIADRTVTALMTIQLTVNATDPDANDIVTLQLNGAPTDMQFEATTGRLAWTPGASDVGVIELEATATDSAGDFDSETFSITIVETPTPPIAVDDAYTVRHRDTLTIPAPGVLDNDTDANNDVLSAANTTDPILGELTAFSADGSFQYQPPPVPPITIGLSQRCDTGDVFGVNQSVVIADVDADGDTEMIVMNQSTFGSGVSIFNPTTCELEATMTPDVIYGEVTGSLLVVNLDADPELEFVMPFWRFGNFDTTGFARLTAFNLDGTPVWGESGLSEELVGVAANAWGDLGASALDLNGDGLVELVVASKGRSNTNVVVAFNGADGVILWEYNGIPERLSARNAVPSFVDLDLDGTLEILFGHSVLSHEGDLEFILAPAPGGVIPDSMRIAVANFDSDPYPEILGIETQNHRLYEHDGTLKWTRAARDPFNQGSNSGGVTIAELDGDPLPEYLYIPSIIGTNDGVIAYDSNGEELWSHIGTDNATFVNGAASSTPTAFDFDRDGIDELVMSLRRPLSGLGGTFIFDGSDGTLLAESRGITRQAPTSSGLMTVADIDGDGAAEIVSLFSLPNFTDKLVVFEGLPGNPFPPARGIRNQWAYSPVMVNDDASIPRNPKPYWLIPGLNKVNAMPVIPGEHPSTVDEFKYIVSDGAADSNEATVGITIATVNAPTIVSNPPLGASPDFEYEYGLLATDADFGDILAWTLVDAPEQMNVSSFGIVSWTPDSDDLGTHRVHLVVTDTQGNTDDQVFDIDVVPPVVVPNLINTVEDDAEGTLDTVGLAVGSVTQAFSLSVPAGQIISQNLLPNDQSAAGAFVNYVVSLGPQPIFLPDVVGLNRATAESALVALTLDAGAVSFANNASVPRGLVLQQSIAANTQVATGALVDLVVSGGPALSLVLATNLAPATTSISVQVAAFDVTGAPMTVPGDLVFNVVPEPGATGTLPVVSSNQVITAGDTDGAYVLSVDVPSLGVVLEETFVVSVGFESEGAHAAYADFSTTLVQLNSLFSQLSDAVAAGDVVTTRTLAMQLEQARATIDLGNLQLTPASAPTEGFLPDIPPGFPGSADDAFGFQIRRVISAINDNQVFLARLNNNVARNDEVRQRFLHENLATQVDAFLSVRLSLFSSVAFRSPLHEMLSVAVPRMVVADVDAALAALREAGLLVSSRTIEDTYVVNNDFSEPMVERQVFFTLGGLMSASSIRMTLIKKLYVPVIKEIVKNMQNLVIEGVTKAFSDVEDIPAVITGASLSFHSFELGHSIIEAPTSAGHKDGTIVYAIGPTLLADLASALDAVKGIRFNTLGNTVRSIKKLKADAENAVQVLQDGYKQFVPSETLNGCVFDNGPTCQQLGFSGGIPTVHKSGSFPAPVLFVTYDAVNGQIALGNFLFFPKPDPDEG